MFFVRVNGISMAAQRRHLNPTIRKFFLPCRSLSGVVKKFGNGAMVRAWVAACADLHRFEAESAHLVQHLVEGQLVVDRVKDADGNFALGRRRTLRLLL